MVLGWVWGDHMVWETGLVLGWVFSGMNVMELVCVLELVWVSVSR